MRRFLALSTGALLACSTAMLAAPVTPAPAVAAPVVVKGQPPVPSGRTVIINTAPTRAGMLAARGAVRAAGGQVSASWQAIGVTAAVVPDKKITSAVKQIRRTKGIVSVGATGEVRQQAKPVPRAKVSKATMAEEPRFPEAAHAMGLKVSGRGVTIGIADDGVFDEHSDIAGKVDQQRSGSCTQGGRFLVGNNEWRPRSTGDTHGTSVSSAATAWAGNGGIRGIAPNAKIVAIRVVSPNGDIYPEASICAVMRASALRLPIMNHSYGLDMVVPTRHALWDPKNADQKAAIDAVNKAFAYSRAHGVLNIAATGNSGDDLSEKSRIPLLPSDRDLGPLPDRLVALLAQVPGVVGVGESDTDGTVMPSSTSGLGLVDISAVGNGNLAKRPGEWEWDAGTSFSSPVVAGAAALVKEAHREYGPAQIEAALLNSARKRSCKDAGLILSEQPCRTGAYGRTSYFGEGLLDARAAVAWKPKSQR